MRRGVANACVVCDDLDFDSCSERRGEERGHSVVILMDFDLGQLAEFMVVDLIPSARGEWVSIR
jgi:hypothetical protein